MPLQVEDVTKDFGRLRSLSHVSLSIETGERRVILGPNGAGKTTLFNTIRGAHFATEGSVRLFGEEVTRLAPHRRVKLGLGGTFQITNLFPNLTVLETLFLGAQALQRGRFIFFRPARFSRQAMARAEELVAEWDLALVAGLPVKELSYGQQRQLEVILAMAGRPRLLLLDEPTSGLSPAETNSMTRFLSGLSRDTTILFIEHDMDVAFELADNVTVLSFGEVLTEGSCAEIQRVPRVLDIYLGHKA
jgi:branched-chain amino acid transport system ATP-binding protein